MYLPDVKKMIAIHPYIRTQKALHVLVTKAVKAISSGVINTYVLEGELVEYPPLLPEYISRAAILDFIKDNIDVIYFLVNAIRSNENIRASIGDYYSRVLYGNLMEVNHDISSPNEYTFSRHFLSNICYLFENTDLAVVEDSLKGMVSDYHDYDNKIDILSDNDSLVAWMYSLNMQHLTYLTLYINRYQFDSKVNDRYEIEAYTMTIDHNPKLHKGILFDTIEEKYHSISASKPYITYAYNHLNLIYDSTLQFKGV